MHMFFKLLCCDSTWQCGNSASVSCQHNYFCQSLTVTVIMRCEYYLFVKAYSLLNCCDVLKHSEIQSHSICPYIMESLIFRSQLETMPSNLPVQKPSIQNPRRSSCQFSNLHGYVTGSVNAQHNQASLNLQWVKYTCVSQKIHKLFN